MRHASEPFYERVYWLPKGVMLKTDHQIVSQAKAIIMQSSLSHAMPPAPLSAIWNPMNAGCCSTGIVMASNGRM